MSEVADVADGVRPVELRERLGAVDATRGLALLGIFAVNVLLMGWPLAVIADSAPPPDAGLASRAAYYLTNVLAIGRSFPLFSLLFGLGLAIQMERAIGAGRRFWPLQVRRLALLALFGAVHALLLWYGDILFVYAVGGLVLLLFFLRRSAVALLRWSAALYALAAVLLVGMTLLSGSADRAATASPDAQTVVVDLGERPFAAFFEQFAAGKLAGPQDPVWVAAEEQSFREGPFGEAVRMRALLWAVSLVSYFALGGIGFSVLALFLIGVALHRSGFFSDAANPWPKRMVGIGAAGLIASVLLATRIAGQEPGVARDLLIAAQTLIGPLVAFGYLGLMALLFRSARGAGGVRAAGTGFGATWLGTGLAALGRMALTNYLLQSLIGAAVFQHWGAAQFGRWPLAAGLGLVLVVWFAQMQFSRFWLARFRFGPMEWLWRTLTYLRWQPIRVGSRAGKASA